jgi:flagellar basal-body rod protein FlgB
MPITNIPVFAASRTRMHWAQERQRLLAENVANANTPDYRPRDLTPPKFDAPSAAPAAAPFAQVSLARTNPAHIAGSAAGATHFRVDRRVGYEVRPAGNAVKLEDEMMKVAANKLDYQTATSLHSRSLALVKMALGKQ